MQTTVLFVVVDEDNSVVDVVDSVVTFSVLVVAFVALVVDVVVAVVVVAVVAIVVAEFVVVSVLTVVIVFVTVDAAVGGDATEVITGSSKGVKSVMVAGCVSELAVLRVSSPVVSSGVLPTTSTGPSLGSSPV